MSDAQGYDNPSATYGQGQAEVPDGKQGGGRGGHVLL